MLGYPGPREVKVESGTVVITTSGTRPLSELDGLTAERSSPQVENFIIEDIVDVLDSKEAICDRLTYLKETKITSKYLTQLQDRVLFYLAVGDTNAALFLAELTSNLQRDSQFFYKKVLSYVSRHESTQSPFSHPNADIYKRSEITLRSKIEKKIEEKEYTKNQTDQFPELTLGFTDQYTLRGIQLKKAIPKEVKGPAEIKFFLDQFSQFKLPLFYPFILVDYCDHVAKAVSASILSGGFGFNEEMFAATREYFRQSGIKRDYYLKYLSGSKLPLHINHHQYFLLLCFPYVVAEQIEYLRQAELLLIRANRESRIEKKIEIYNSILGFLNEAITLGSRFNSPAPRLLYMRAHLYECLGDNSRTLENYDLFMESKPCRINDILNYPRPSDSSALRLKISKKPNPTSNLLKYRKDITLTTCESTAKERLESFSPYNLIRVESGASDHTKEYERTLKKRVNKYLSLLSNGCIYSIFIDLRNPPDDLEKHLVLQIVDVDLEARYGHLFSFEKKLEAAPPSVTPTSMPPASSGKKKKKPKNKPKIQLVNPPKVKHPPSTLPVMTSYSSTMTITKTLSHEEKVSKHKVDREKNADEKQEKIRDKRKAKSIRKNERLQTILKNAHKALEEKTRSVMKEKEVYRPQEIKHTISSNFSLSSIPKRIPKEKKVEEIKLPALQAVLENDASPHAVQAFLDSTITLLTKTRDDKGKYPAILLCGGAAFNARGMTVGERPENIKDVDLILDFNKTEFTDEQIKELFITGILSHNFAVKEYSDFYSAKCEFPGQTPSSPPLKIDITVRKKNYKLTPNPFIDTAEQFLLAPTGALAILPEGEVLAKKLQETHSNKVFSLDFKMLEEDANLIKDLLPRFVKYLPRRLKMGYSLDEAIQENFFSPRSTWLTHFLLEQLTYQPEKIISEMNKLQKMQGFHFVKNELPHVFHSILKAMLMKIFIGSPLLRDEMEMDNLVFSMKDIFMRNVSRYFDFDVIMATTVYEFFNTENPEFSVENIIQLVQMPMPAAELAPTISLFPPASSEMALPSLWSESFSSMRMTSSAH